MPTLTYGLANTVLADAPEVGGAYVIDCRGTLITGRVLACRMIGPRVTEVTVELTDGEHRRLLAAQV
jgi:hypothetical protein